MEHTIPAFADALTSDDEARNTFAWMGSINQAQFLGWIKSAVTEVESRKRIQSAVDMLAGRDVVRRN